MAPAINDVFIRLIECNPYTYHLRSSFFFHPYLFSHLTNWQRSLLLTRTYTNWLARTLFVAQTNGIIFVYMDGIDCLLIVVCVCECLSVDCQSLTPCHTNNNYYYELLSIGHLFSSRFRVVIFICTVESIVASRLNCHCCSDGVHLLLLNQQSHNAMIVVLHVIIIARPMQLLLWSIGQLNIYMCFAVALNDSFINQLCKIRLKLIPIIRWWDERFC